MTRASEEKRTRKPRERRQPAGDLSKETNTPADTGGEIIQDEQAPKMEARYQEYYGPVFLDSYTADNQGSYFYVDDPGKLPERAVAVRVPPHLPAIASLLATAFNGGQKVLVAPGHRWWLGQNKLAWTIWAAKISY